MPGRFLVKGKKMPETIIIGGFAILLLIIVISMRMGWPYKKPLPLPVAIVAIIILVVMIIAIVVEGFEGPINFLNCVIFGLCK